MVRLREGICSVRRGGRAPLTVLARFRLSIGCDRKPRDRASLSLSYSLKKRVAVNREGKAKLTFAFVSLDNERPSYYWYRMWRLYSDSRVSRLEERIVKLETDLRTATLDFDELYQKCRKLLGRTVKERASIELAHQSKEEPAAGDPAMAGNGTPHGFLSESQKLIQQKILRRRAGLS